MSTDETTPPRERRAGVPDTLLEQLTPWLATQCARGHAEGESYSRATLQAIESTFARRLTWSGDDTPAAFDSLLTLVRDDRALCLDVVDCMLDRLRFTADSAADDEAAATELERILDDEASAWAVSSGTPKALERRPAPEVEAIVRAVIDSHTPPGDELRNAWRYAWGRRANPSVAYRATLRSVEFALGPLITRAGSAPTLPHLIPVLRDDLAQFEVRPGADDTLLDANAVLAGLESLQQGLEQGRGTGYPQDPLVVTPVQAQAATVLAARLVHLAQTGAFHRRA